MSVPEEYEERIKRRLLEVELNYISCLSSKIAELDRIRYATSGELENRVIALESAVFGKKDKKDRRQ